MIIMAIPSKLTIQNVVKWIMTKVRFGIMPSDSRNFDSLLSLNIAKVITMVKMKLIIVIKVDMSLRSCMIIININETERAKEIAKLAKDNHHIRFAFLSSTSSVCELKASSNIKATRRYTWAKIQC